MIYLKAKDNSGYIIFNVNRKLVTIINTKKGSSDTRICNTPEFLDFMQYHLKDFEVLEELPKAVEVLYAP